MELYIRIQNGVPYEHPLTKSNILSAYPGIDLDQATDRFVKFERVEPPEIGPYEKAFCTYEFVDGIVKDIWSIQAMTDEEKTAKQNQVKATWTEMNGYASWVFNEDECCFLPPIDPPQDGQRYMWNEGDLQWEMINPQP